MSLEHEIDFEVLREPWNKYELEDGAYIKSRYILTKFKEAGPDQQGKTKISIDGQTIAVVYNAPTELRGSPSTERYSPEQIKEAIEIEVSYKVISEEWNEYIAENGAKIRIKDDVIRISRTTLKDKNGDPVYFVEHSTLVHGTPPKR